MCRGWAGIAIVLVGCGGDPTPAESPQTPPVESAAVDPVAAIAAVPEDVVARSAAPITIPSGLQIFAARAERECAARAAPRPASDCRAVVEALATEDDGHRAVALVSIWDRRDGGTSDDTYDDESAGTFVLATYDGSSWTRQDEVYALPLSGSRHHVAASLRYEDVLTGDGPEILVDLDDHWSHEQDEGGASGHEQRLIVCGDPPGEPAFVCASIERGSDRESAAAVPPAQAGSPPASDAAVAMLAVSDCAE